MDQINRNPNDPNKGLDVRKFSISIVIAFVIIVILSFIVLRTDRNALHGASKPKPTSAASPQ